MATSTIAKNKPVAMKKQAEQRLKQAQAAAILLKQVSDPTRLLIIDLLSDGERHVGAMCQELGQTQPAVSHHLALLRHGKVVEVRRQGKNNIYALAAKGEVLSRIVKSVLG